MDAFKALDAEQIHKIAQSHGLTISADPQALKQLISFAREVEKTAIEHQAIPLPLIQQLWEQKVTFERIIDTSTLLSTHALPAFRQFTHSCDRAEFNEMAQQHEGFAQVLSLMRKKPLSHSRSREVAQAIFVHCTDIKYIIQLQIATPSHIQLNDNGEVESIKYGVGYKMVYIMVSSMHDAALIGLEKAKSILTEKIEQEKNRLATA